VLRVVVLLFITAEVEVEVITPMVVALEDLVA
jgi:hypothetical protein